jgi:hypothetical protein
MGFVAQVIIAFCYLAPTLLAVVDIARYVIRRSADLRHIAKSNRERHIELK